ncbi:hypothetical protein RSAG8_09925, partial [Rhizoctonia solani AG-8 WAC10335]
MPRPLKQSGWLGEHVGPRPGESCKSGNCSGNRAVANKTATSWMCNGIPMGTKLDVWLLRWDLDLSWMGLNTIQ